MEQKIFYKGFDKDLCCRGMQYEIGETYDTGAAGITAADLCSGKTLHFSKTLNDVDYYYSVPMVNKPYRNRFCEIECLGTLVEDGNVCGSTRIRIIRELSWEEITVLAGLDKNNAGKFNAGNRNAGNRNAGNRNAGDYNAGNNNSGDYNSGNHNSGSFNTGNYNSGNRNAGNYNSGNRNAGDYNAGNYNSGNRNAGDYNSGKFNSGDYNSGAYNSGDYNTGDSNSGTCNSGNSNAGDYNSGNRNAGYFNAGNGSTGVFCTEKPKIHIFNMPTDMTLIEFRDTKWYKALNSASFPLTEWVDGCLKTLSYKDACAIWWKTLTDENKGIIMTMPNFDKDVFFQITGIKL